MIDLDVDELFGRDAVAEALILMGKKLFLAVGFLFPRHLVRVPSERSWWPSGWVVCVGVCWCVVRCIGFAVWNLEDRCLCLVLAVC